MESTIPAVCHSPAIAELLTRLDRLAVMDQKTANPCNVVIQGETGTGKDLIARRIHEKSGRVSAAFVAVNCSAMPVELFESELFGHEKGAFTSAYAQKKGLLEQALGGTLFLDEVGDLPIQLQVKLLRALQHKVVRRVGGLKDIQVDVRVIAASNRDLSDLAKGGLFRSDLLYRLSVFPVTVPPLRERQEDIPVLTEHFCDVFAAKYVVSRKRVTAAATDALLRHQWPGNVRELEHVLEYAYIASANDEITEADIADKLGISSAAAVPESEPQASSIADVREHFRRVIESLPVDLRMRDFTALAREARASLCSKRLNEHGGNVSKAAASLGLDRSSFHRMLRSEKRSAGRKADNPGE